MNLVLTTTLNSNLTDISEAIKPAVVITDGEPDVDLKLAKLALEVDKLIYNDRMSIDAVYMVRNLSDRHNSLTCPLPNTVYFTGNGNRASFFCCPHTFSMIGNLYKIDFTRYDFVNTVDADPGVLQFEKIVFLINRLGIDICVV